MQGVDRINGPQIEAIQDISLPKLQRLDQEQGIPIYFLEGGTEQISRVECIFPAGRKYEQKKAVASLTTKLLQEGTINKSSTELAETLDFYGFRFKARNDFDFSYISISCMSKYFQKAIALLFEIINNPSFPENELAIAKKTASNNLKIQLERNEFVAYRLLTESIFGKEHSYGYNTNPEDFTLVSREDILHFYNENYKLSNAFVIVSGVVDKNNQSKLVEYLSARSTKEDLEKQYVQTVIEKEGKHIVEKIENSFQASLKIGKKTCKRNHPDFYGMLVLSTVLGGYFGSRLMQSIREKHGYSYNIYSAIEIMEEDAYFSISTDVGSQYAKAAMKVIFEEIEKLQKTEISDEELKMVKNYLLGKILRDLDGPFNSAATLRNLLVSGGNLSDLPQLVQGVREIKSSDLLVLAQRYFDKKSFTTVIVS